MSEATRAFIRANLPLAPVPFVPEIRLHKAVLASGLGRLAERDESFGSPYWAHYWSGGLVLARYLLDHPEQVAGRRVLDIGTGSGLVAIAAALAGARKVVAADVDPYAVVAAALNAEANQVRLTLRPGDPTRTPAVSDFDLITVGDLFYDRATAERVLRFGARCVEAGAEMLIGDPGRAFLPLAELEPVASFAVCELSGGSGPSAKPAGVFRPRLPATPSALPAAAASSARP
ncbi:class I SAM-dependent methyltransferase [Sphingosinicella terrae]|uniref:class I SAM-dependent methyltransferase n=1 Tax=Sphingosinicella terrae TaxID=2172047 RepID=UPI000E0D6A82|nr:50S ribosomal protein L11 methyltransferase [Sphingosinicella terrae]